MDNQELETYSEYWTENYWVLVGPKFVDSNQNELYSIIDIERHMYAIIEDSNIANYIIKKMLDKGVKVYDSITELPERTIPASWTSFTEQDNFDKAIAGRNLSDKEINKLFRHCAGKKLNVQEIIQKINELGM